MKIDDILSPDDTIVSLRAPDKARLIHELANRAAQILHLDAAKIAQDVLKREDLGSTGLGNGIAVPHARLPEVQKPFGILARLKRPIDYDAIDNQPVDLVFFLLLPAADQNAQINALAAVARKLREPERRQRMRQAEDEAALFREISL
jgi:PTS system nitrogen regulatory IIA component